MVELGFDNLILLLVKFGLKLELFLLENNYFIFWDKKNLGWKSCWVKKIWVRNFLGETKFGPEIFLGKKNWVEKQFGLKNFGRKFFWVRKKLGGNFFGWKKVGSKKNLSQKSFRVKKNLGRKFFWIKKKLGRNFFWPKFYLIWFVCIEFQFPAYCWLEQQQHRVSPGWVG